MSGAAIAVENLVAGYGRRAAVHHLSGGFAPGSLTAVVGPNGAGKTTLLRTIAGLHPADEGRVRVNGRIALLPQAAAMDRGFPLACRDVAMQGLWAKLGAFRAATPADRSAAEAALEAVGLGRFAARPVGSLSAGQFQRLLFARLLLQDAPLVLLDEPFNAVDSKTAADLLAVVKRWHGEGRTIIAVLHDLDLVRREFPQTLMLARDAIAWGETATVLTAANRLRARMMAEHWDDEALTCAA